MCRGCTQTKSPATVPGGLQKLGRAAAFRKRSMAQRTVTSIESEIELFVSKCSFLASSEDGASSPCVAKFHRSEIEVGELLGKGAFSEVYQVKAVHPCFEHEEEEEESLRAVVHQACETQCNDADQFIVKHLRPELLTQRSAFNNAAADLVLEARFLAALDHPNIIKIHGWAANGASSYNDGSHDGFFIMLEQLDDILSRRISRWRRDASSAPPMEQRLGYATQIASALQYLHSNNIIYRDLKCDNIGFKHGAIRLFDLGLCRELPENSSRDDKFQMSGVGTLRYVAPEILLSTGYNLGADVYSFSIVLYELLSVAKPFDLYNIDMYRMLVCEDGERPQLDATWPLGLQSLLTSMWDQESSLRPSMDEIHAQLLEIRSKVIAPKGGLKRFISFRKRMVRMATGSFSEGTSTTVTSAASFF